MPIATVVLFGTIVSIVFFTIYIKRGFEILNSPGYVTLKSKHNGIHKRITYSLFWPFVVVHDYYKSLTFCPIEVGTTCPLYAEDNKERCCKCPSCKKVKSNKGY